MNSILCTVQLGVTIIEPGQDWTSWIDRVQVLENLKNSFLISVLVKVSVVKAHCRRRKALRIASRASGIFSTKSGMYFCKAVMPRAFFASWLKLAIHSTHSGGTTCPVTGAFHWGRAFFSATHGHHTEQTYTCLLWHGPLPKFSTFSTFLFFFLSISCSLLYTIGPVFFWISQIFNHRT